MEQKTQARILAEGADRLQPARQYLPKLSFGYVHKDIVLGWRKKKMMVKFA